MGEIVEEFIKYKALCIYIYIYVYVYLPKSKLHCTHNSINNIKINLNTHESPTKLLRPNLQLTNVLVVLEANKLSAY